MRRLVTVRVVGWLGVAVVVSVLGVLGLACSKSSPDAAGGGAPAAAATAAAPGTVSDFDRKWSALAATDTQAFYVEDDRGEGLMGNVRRSHRSQKLSLLSQPKAAAPGALDPNASPEVPSPEA